jgi:hypothetical protein
LAVLDSQGKNFVSKSFVQHRAPPPCSSTKIA